MFDSEQQRGGHEPHKRPDSDDLGGLSWIRDEFRSTTKDLTVRFTIQDCESPSAFLRALQPGDLVTTDSGMVLILAHQALKRGVQVSCLSERRARNSKPDGLAIETFTVKDRRAHQFKEVFSLRGSAAHGIKEELLTPCALHNAAVLLGIGPLGAEFRNAGFNNNPAVLVHLNAEGMITKTSRKGEGFRVQPALEVTHSAFLSTKSDPIISITPLVPIGADLEVELETARRVANAFDRVTRLCTVRGISMD